MRSSLLWLKVFALAIALFLWVQHMLLREQTAVIDLPLDLVNIPDSLTLAQTRPTQVPVMVTARGVDIVLMKLGNARLQVNAEAAMQGRNELEVGVPELVASDYVQTYDMTLRSRYPLWFELDRLERMRKVVTLQYASENDRSWFTRQSLSVEPESVFVQGPADLLSRLDEVRTEPLKHLPTTNRTLEARLEPPGPLFTMEHDEVTLKLARPEFVTKDFNQITIRNPYEDRFAIFPGKVNLLVQGTRDTMEELDRAFINVTLASSEPDEDDEIGLVIELPAGYQVVSYTPETIQVIFHEPIPDSGD